MSFTEYLRLCLGLGLGVAPILAFAFGLTWLIVALPLNALVAIALIFTQRSSLRRHSPCWRPTLWTSSPPDITPKERT